MQERSSATVLVTGVNRTQGRAVARALLHHGYRVRGLVRSRSSDLAQVLTQEGIELVEENFATLGGLRTNLEGIHAIYAAGLPPEAGLSMEVRQAERLIQAAVLSGVHWFVFGSISDASHNTGIPLFDRAFAVEEYLRNSGLPFAILAPVYFAENLLTVNVLAQLRQGRLSLPLPADRRLQVIGLRDLGEFAVQVFDHPAAFSGARLNLASDEITGARMAQILSRRLGRSIDYVPRPVEQVRGWNPDYAQMFEWLNRIGFSADIEALRGRFPAIGWRRFEQWAAEQDWNRILGDMEAA